MASKIIGGKACPECGFGAAHIKQSEKCTYRYCPECGATYYAKGEAATARLVSGMRPEQGAQTPSVPSSSVATVQEGKPPATVAITTAQAPAPRRSAL
jgi:ssDNA-binding Zn-finger/Zn-ribbon topoisomerase 1